MTAIQTSFIVRSLQYFLDVQLNQTMYHTIQYNPQGGEVTAFLEECQQKAKSKKQKARKSPEA
jgi:hypothetical protein